MTYETAYNILREDLKTDAEAKKRLDKNLVVIFSRDDFEAHFDEYMQSMFGDYDEDDFSEAVADHKHMIDTMDPLTDWGCVRYQGNDYYIMYEN